MPYGQHPTPASPLARTPFPHSPRSQRPGTGPPFPPEDRPGRWAGPGPGPEKSFQSEATDLCREMSRCYPRRRAPPLGLNCSPLAHPHPAPSLLACGPQFTTRAFGGFPEQSGCQRLRVLSAARGVPRRSTSSPAGRGGRGGGRGGQWGPAEPGTRRTRQPPDKLRELTAAALPPGRGAWEPGPACPEAGAGAGSFQFVPVMALT